MSEGFQFLDIIFFAMVAGFILLRLRSMLGRRTGHQQRPANPLARSQAEEASDNVISLPEREAEAEEAGDDFADVDDSTLAAGLAQIKLADPGFTREAFLDGAHQAFEYIIDAYAAGDADALRSLLDDDVYRPFAGAIRERADAGHALESTLVSIDESELLEAGMNGRTAFVTVRFVSQQINVTRDTDDAIVEGDPSVAVAVTDIWTFERDTRSRDPNWKLAATRSPN